jgi:hypothetical protein
VVDVSRFTHGARVVAFEELLRAVRPDVVLDLRSFPEFYFQDNYVRRQTFALFREVGAEYRDVAGMLAVRSRSDPNLRPDAVVEDCSEILAERSTACGRVVVFVDDVEVAEQVAATFIERLRPCPEGGWKVRVMV